MATFIQNCVCQGARPSYLTQAPSFLRNNLLSRMMLERSRVRYLVAPEGLGKTMLAISYAQLVNDFDGTVWVDASNPCFLRDLDSGELEKGLIEVAQAGSVTVFDDVPVLDQVRGARLWSACQRLLERGCEVVVCSNPSADPLGPYARDCLVLGSRDLLYSNDDLLALQSSAVSSWRMPPPRGPVDRIPCLARRSPGSYERFLAGHIAQLGNTHQRALSLVALVLERGTSDDLSEAMGGEAPGGGALGGRVPGNEVFLEDLRADSLRPFISVNENLDEFEASGMPLAEVMRAFASVVGSIAKEVGLDGASDLSLRLASMLMSRGSGARAASLVAGNAAPAARFSWLKQNQDLMLARLDLLAAEEVFDTLRRLQQKTPEQLVCGSLVRRALLSSYQPGIDEATHALAGSHAPMPSRLLAASVLFLACSQAPASRLDHGSAGRAGSAGPEGSEWALGISRALAGSALSACAANSQLGPLSVLARFWESVGVPDAQPSQMLDDAARQLAGVVRLQEAAQAKAFKPTVQQPFCPANFASLLVACLLKGCAVGVLPSSLHSRASDLGSACLQAAVEQHAEGVCELLLYGQLLVAQGRGGAHGGSRSGERKSYSVLRLDTMRSSIDVQRAAYQREHPSSSGASTSSASRITSSYSYTTGLAGVPMLHIGVFGRFDVRRGDETLRSEGFRRSKVRILLVLLALEDGRDLSCDRLSCKLWPDSEPEAARHNLYSTISVLRKSLSLPGGNCPYIHREVGVVGLNPDVVRSDVADLDLLCRKLRFDEADPDAFLRVLDQVRAIYRGELLPGEVDDPLIVAARSAWLDKIVDSLMVGARRLAARSDGRVALQLVQHALEMDPRREDSYELLMTLQADCGQRPAAIDTWFTYCRYVDSELGLDPAPRVKDLYNRIIS